MKRSVVVLLALAFAKAGAGGSHHQRWTFKEHAEIFRESSGKAGGVFKAISGTAKLLSVARDFRAMGHLHISAYMEGPPPNVNPEIESWATDELPALAGDAEPTKEVWS